MRATDIYAEQPRNGLENVANIPSIDLLFDHQNPDASALDLIHAYDQTFNNDNNGEVKLSRFTEGITNNLIKVTLEVPGKSKSEIDENAILLRAYGAGTEALIDRKKEIKTHDLLASRGLAPSLLARFNNGILYRFCQGSVCGAEDLRRPEVYRQTAMRLGEWHGGLPISAISDCSTTRQQSDPEPNIWTLIPQWIDALPSDTLEQQKEAAQLRSELDWIIPRLSKVVGPRGNKFVFSHGDLLSANILLVHPSGCQPNNPFPSPVSFIDYEYAIPAPAAFDIANHFAEWAGFACDHSCYPTAAQRKEFLEYYAKSFTSAADSYAGTKSGKRDVAYAIELLFEQVELFRGFPGFYWAVWAMNQAVLSSGDFDYKNYAGLRLKEYWAWKAEYQAGADSVRAKV